VKSHFAAPPYDFYELKQVPGAHVVTTSTEIMGSPLSQGQFFTTTKFAAANPKVIQAVRGAAEEAKAFIEGNLVQAIEAYKEINHDKTPTETLVEMLKRPGMMEWNLYPQGTMKFAAHLHKIGTLKSMPASWKDYYLPIAHDLPGN
jgi:NitT/TauT family transport system substrate-binding protein